jgi:hypothetical protein
MKGELHINRQGYDDWNECVLDAFETWNVTRIETESSPIWVCKNVGQ